MKLAQIVATAVGVGLMFTPAVAGYAGTAASDVHRTVGPLVAACGVIAFWPATRDVRLANVVLAAVLVGAPLAGGHPAPATWVALVAAVLLVATVPFGGPDPEARGAGWRGVLSDRGR